MLYSPELGVILPEKFESCIKNINFNQGEINKIKERLYKSKKFLKLLDSAREKRKKEYFEKVINFTDTEINKLWFFNNPYRISTFVDLFSETELRQMIDKIIEKSIKINNNLEPYWANLLLFEISLSHDKIIFSDYIENLLFLNYRQIVRDFLIKYPNNLKRIEQDQKAKLGNFYLDIIEIHPKLILKPVVEFAWCIDTIIYLHGTIRVFYDKYPDFRGLFTDILKKKIETIDFSKEKKKLASEDEGGEQEENLYLYYNQ